MPSELYDTILLKFYMVGCCDAGGSNVTPPLQESGTAYVDERFDVSQPYDALILCTILETICPLAWVTLQKVEYRTHSAYTETLAPLTKPSSPILYHAFLTNDAATLPMLLRAELLRLL